MSKKLTYQAPELVEVGEAQKVTLGTNGTDADNCGCSLAQQDQ